MKNLTLPGYKTYLVSTLGALAALWLLSQGDHLGIPTLLLSGVSAALRAAISKIKQQQVTQIKGIKIRYGRA